MNEKRNFDYKRLHPFKWYILENFPFLEDSIDVLTNYQLFCKLGEMYNKQVNAINTLGVQVEGITDWFDDLDVQEEVNNKLDEMAESGELAEIMADYASQKVDYIEITNQTQDEIQEIFNIQRAKVIKFLNNFTFTETMRLNANTTLDLNGKTLTFDIPSATEDWTKSHGFFNFKDTDEFTGFNGNSNITIQNGTIIGGNASFIHANNINFKNLYFKNCQNGHILEMCAINNLLVDGCTFEGVPADSENYIEYIQFDNCTYPNFPLFSNSESATYDHTVGKNVLIKNCIFKKPANTNYHFPKAVGMHSYQDNEIFENIIIENCEFNDMLNMGIELINANNIQIKNNYFYKNGTTENITGAMIRTRQVASNITIENNIFEGNYKAIENSNPPINNINLKILNNTFRNYKIVGDEEYPIVLVFNNKNCLIKNNIFEDFTQNAIRLEGRDLENYSEMSYIIENNIFKPLNNYTLYMIKAYTGNCYINNNTFDTDGVTFTNGHCIVTNSDNKFNKLYAKGNQFSHNIVSNFNDIWDRKDANSYYDTFGVLKKVWSGSTINANNETVSQPFNHFNRMLLTIGDGAHTQSIKLANFNPEQKIDARTFSIPSVKINDGTLTVSNLTINNDGTFNWSGSNLRNIFLYNE